jgi:hypothetical protein
MCLKRPASLVLTLFMLYATSGCAGYAARVRKAAEERATAAVAARAVAAAAAADEAARARADSIAAMLAMRVDSNGVDSAGASVNAPAVLVDTVTSPDGWDAAVAMQLMRRASLRRAAPLADTSLHNYRGRAEGYLYLFGDRPASSQHLLLNVSQVGLALYWKQPGIWRQRVVGMRRESPIPNGVRFHVDHFTMIQNGFGNTMRVGGGDEVRDVMHPAAPGAGTFYHYRLADSLELVAAGTRIRVYEVQVKPRDTSMPGIVGSVYLDKASAAIVRMNFTFTPASYVRPGIDYINISMDNALYKERYWLPREQLVEIRRAMPFMDLGVGSVIRSRIKVQDYELNASIPDSIFQARPIVAGRFMFLADYPFERGVFDDLNDAGLRKPPELTELRKEAEDIVRQELLSGLPPVRFYAPDMTSLFRYNRAEGVFLGAGLSYTPKSNQRYDVLAGYALGSDLPSVHARAIHNASIGDVMIEGYARRRNDLGLAHPGAGFWNTLSAAASADDYLDLWYSTGLRASLQRALGETMTATITASAEEQGSASRVKDRAIFNRSASFRDVLPIEEGRDFAGTLALARSSNAGTRFSWSGSAELTGGAFESHSYVRTTLSLGGFVTNESRSRDARVTLLSGHTTSGDVPQHMFLVGGRGTVPGYDYRSFVGRSAAVMNAQAGVRVINRWLGVRVLGAAASVADDPVLTTAQRAAGWSVRGTDGVRASAGLGVGLLWSTVNVDVMRGLNGGHWEVDLSIGRNSGNQF